MITIEKKATKVQIFQLTFDDNEKIDVCVEAENYLSGMKVLVDHSSDHEMDFQGVVDIKHVGENILIS